MTTQSTFVDKLHIRPATVDDAPVIHSFICLLEESTLSYDAFLTIFQRNIANPSIHYYVAELSGDVVGFVSCYVQYLLHHCGPVGEIQELFVRSDRRNQRIGHKLLHTLNTLAVREGFVNLEVTTNQKRLDTVRFYERESFRRTHYKLVKPIQTNL